MDCENCIQFHNCDFIVSLLMLKVNEFEQIKKSQNINNFFVQNLLKI